MRRPAFDHVHLRRGAQELAIRQIRQVDHVENHVPEHRDERELQDVHAIGLHLVQSWHRHAANALLNEPGGGPRDAPHEGLPHASREHWLDGHGTLQEQQRGPGGVRQPPGGEPNEDVLLLQEPIGRVRVLYHEVPEAEAQEDVVVAQGTLGRAGHEHEVREDGPWVSVAHHAQQPAEDPRGISLVATLLAQHHIAVAGKANHQGDGVRGSGRQDHIVVQPAQRPSFVRLIVVEVRRGYLLGHEGPGLRLTSP
mmetsp:Transcript_78467/g.188136  ORF Transcript_78467/g.188136 Transcript_78467/m.188136 type:complete len:253 (-) Transcript_78467:136-894(-)